MGGAPLWVGELSQAGGLTFALLRQPQQAAEKVRLGADDGKPLANLGRRGDGIREW
jgi:hypothetical protein